MSSLLNGVWLVVLRADGSPLYQMRCNDQADRNSRADERREIDPKVKLLSIDVFGNGEIRVAVPWRKRDRQG